MNKDDVDFAIKKLTEIAGPTTEILCKEMVTRGILYFVITAIFAAAVAVMVIICFKKHKCQDRHTGDDGWLIGGFIMAFVGLIITFVLSGIAIDYVCSPHMKLVETLFQVAK